MRRGGVLTLWRGRHYFKRKSTQLPTTPTVSTRSGRQKLKLPPRSQSLGSLSVNTSPTKCGQLFTNRPLRMATSVDANNFHGLHNPDFVSVFVFERGAAEAKPKLRRTQNSMFCLAEELPLDSSVNNACTNLNNNIYADVDMKMTKREDSESIKSGQLAGQQQENVAIEINRVDSSLQLTVEQHLVDSPPNESLKNSIDAHLDKIDEINRVLDDRLKRNLIQVITDLDAIETVESSVLVISRNKNNDNIQNDKSCSQRSSSSSSAADQLHKLMETQNTQHKKRSLSFSQKSINAIFSNIKEFSKTPLTKMHMYKTENLAESSDAAENSTTEDELNGNVPNISNDGIQQNNQTCSTHSSSSNNNNLSSSSSSCKDSNHNSHSRLKFKVPKLKKSSKALGNTFRSKIMHFQLKRSKICKKCSKRQRIHPSKSVFDFAKEFNLTQMEGILDDDKEFCQCPPPPPPPNSHRAIMINSSTNTEHTLNSMSSAEAADVEDDSSDGDVLSMKDHCYCVPSLSTNVSKFSLLFLIMIKRENEINGILLFTNWLLLIFYYFLVKRIANS